MRLIHNLESIYCKHQEMLSRLIQIINEEVTNYFSDWQVDEPDIADKYYEKKLGISKESNVDIDAELVGYVEDDGKLLKKPIPVYKNPKNLNGFSNDARGVILNNGDFYLAQSHDSMHTGILKLLAKHSIIPEQTIIHYSDLFPNEFVAVIRHYGKNEFLQSEAYDTFPITYRKIFDLANQKQPFKFSVNFMYY